MDITNIKNKGRITYKLVADMMFDPKFRMKWDSNLKVFDVLQETQNFQIVRFAINSPLFIIKERDTIDKKLSFSIDGRFYSFGSAVPEHLYPVYDEYVRVKPLLNLFSFVILDDCIEFIGFNQVDGKMKFPEFIYQITIPLKAREFYKNFEKALCLYIDGGYDALVNGFSHNHVKLTLNAPTASTSPEISRVK